MALGRQGVVEGQLLRRGLMPITGVEGWGDRMEAHMDHACLMMRSHAQGETPVHSGELGVVEVGGTTTTGGGDDKARSHSSAGFRGSKGKEVGRHRTAQRTGPPPPSPLSPLSPPLPKWQIGCSSAAVGPALVATTGCDSGGGGPAAAGEAATCTAGSAVGAGCGAGRGEGEGRLSGTDDGAGGTQTKGTSAAAAPAPAVAAAGGGERRGKRGGLAVPLWCCPGMAVVGRGRKGPAVRGGFDSAAVVVAASGRGAHSRECPPRRCQDDDSP